MAHGVKKGANPMDSRPFCPAPCRTELSGDSSGSSNFACWQLFFDTCGLAGTFAEVVQLGATNITTTFHLQLYHQWGVGLECALYAHACGDFTHSKRAVQAAIFLGDNHAFESLQTLTVTLLDLNLHNHGVAGCKAMHGFVQPIDFFLFKNLNQVH